MKENSQITMYCTFYRNLPTTPMAKFNVMFVSPTLFVILKVATLYIKNPRDPQKRRNMIATKVGCRIIFFL